MRIAAFSADDVLLLAKRYGASVACGNCANCLPLVDRRRGIAEGELAATVVDRHRLPRPETQIPVLDGRGQPFALLDMGWRTSVAVEYDGDQHRTDRPQYVKDIAALRKIEKRWVESRSASSKRTSPRVTSVERALGARALAQITAFRELAFGRNVRPRRGGGPPDAPAQQRDLVDLQRGQVADHARQQVGRQAADCAPDTARAGRSRRRCPAPHRRCRRPARLPAPLIDLGQRLEPTTPEPFRRGGSRSPSTRSDSSGSRGCDTTSPMVRLSCGDVVTSSIPTPSTRSPDDVSYQCPST